jgi:arginine/serine-rich splicing factor 4/5/6
MSARLFVGKLSERTSESSLRRLFEEYGDVRSIESKGPFAFVVFESEQQGKNAVEKLNGTELDGNNIVVEMARQAGGNNKDLGGRLVRRLDLRILIRGVARGTNWTDLKDWARAAGDVTYTNVFDRDGQTFGVVEYRVRIVTEFVFLF